MAKKKRANVKRGKYHDWITEEGLKRLEMWAGEGLSDKFIAENRIGVSEKTLENWKNRFPEVVTALKKGKEKDYRVEKALEDSTQDRYIEEEKIYIQEIGGKVTKRKEVYKKFVPANTTAQIFWLKNRHPDKWQNEHPVKMKEWELRLDRVQLENERLRTQLQVLAETLSRLSPDTHTPFDDLLAGMILLAQSDERESTDE